MTYASDQLRDLIRAGKKVAYDCPCRAEGRLVEVRPNLFEVYFLHETWCPVPIPGKPNDN